MTTNDGATSARKKLAKASNVSDATASTMSGADLEFARLSRQSGVSDADGNRLEQASAGTPRVGSLTVTGGSTAGGTATGAIGSGLKDVTAVTVGGAAATAVVVVDDNRVNFTSPAGTAGAKDVVVTGPDGSDTLAGSFTYA
jgi:hypothetical protein